MLQIIKLKYIPESNAFASPYTTFKFKVNDSQLDSVEYTATIHVNSVDDKPVLQALSNVLKERNFTTFTINLNASDIDGDIITYDANSSNTSVATVSTTNNQLQVVAGANTSGTTTITAIATANSVSVNQSFTLTVNSKIVIDINDTSMDEDSVLAFNLADIIIDPENESYDINATTNKEGDLVDTLIDDGVLTLRALPNKTGTFDLTINVNDGFFTVTKTVTITINPVDDNPTPPDPDDGSSFGEDPNVQSTEKVKFNVGGIDYIAYSDLSKGGKLSISKNNNGTWGYFTLDGSSTEAMSTGVASNISVTVGRRKVTITYTNDGSSGGFYETSKGAF